MLHTMWIILLSGACLAGVVAAYRLFVGLLWLLMAGAYIACTRATAKWVAWILAVCLVIVLVWAIRK